MSSDTHDTQIDTKRAVQNVGVLVVASIISKGVLFVWQIVLGNWLGVTDYGIYNTVFALIAVAMPVASFSMGLILIREVAKHPERTAQYWSTVLIVQTVLAGVAYAGAVVSAILAGYSDLIIAYTAIASLSVLIDVFGSQGNDLLLAQERMPLASAIEIGHIVLRVGLSVLALAIGWGLLGVYVATIASGLMRTSILWGVHWRDGLRPSFPIDRVLLREMLINSAPLAITAVLTLAYQHADKLMTTAIIGERNTGYLGPAFVINFGVIEVLSTSIIVAIYPMMARYHGDGKNELFGFLVEKVTRFIFILILPITLILSIYADDIVALIFAPEFAPTAGVLRILIWYTCLTVTGNMIAKAFIIQNRQQMVTLIRSFGLALNILLNTIFLLQWRDPRGAAIASVLAEILILVLFIWRFKAKGWQIVRFLQGVLGIVLLGLMAGGIMLILHSLPLLMGAIVGGIVYVVLLLFTPILQNDDWDLIYRIVTNIPFGHLITRYWQRELPSPQSD
jgi:O-antigen/teichoic acid export membrane protein